nr:hypothetical protein BaRGS_014579 [Batillaria attramentaria]
MSARQRNRRGVFGTLLASLVLVLTMTSPAVADVFTASHKIAELAGIEGQLLDTLRNFINEEYDQLKALSQFLLERSKEYRLSLESRPPESQSQILKHPNAAYQLIKWYVKTWTRRMDNSPCFKSRLKSEVTSLVPVFKDFEGALSALVRLHHIYRLNASDMYDGNYLGYQGPRLEPDDAFEVGRQAFVDGLPQESRQWLELAADKMREDWRKQKEEGQGKTARPRAQQVTRSLAWTLALLGRAYYVSEIRPYHVCRYKPALHSPYLQYKEEILSQEPYVSVFYDVVNDTEIDTIKQFVKGTSVRPGSRGGRMWDDSISMPCRVSDELTEYCGEELYVYSSAVLKVNGYYSDETCSVDIRASHAEYKNEVRLELMSLQANCQRNWIQLHANNAPLSNKLCGLENALTMYVTYPSDTLTVTIGTNKWGSEITSRMLATSTSTYESLQCDGYNNCGDWSDEDSDLCGTDVAVSWASEIGIIAGASVVCFVVIVLIAAVIDPASRTMIPVKDAVFPYLSLAGCPRQVNLEERCGEDVIIRDAQKLTVGNWTALGMRGTCSVNVTAAPSSWSYQESPIQVMFLAQTFQLPAVDGNCSAVRLDIWDIKNETLITHPCEDDVEFGCDNDRCVATDLQCNDDNDCGDESDEKDGCIMSNTVYIIIGVCTGGLVIAVVWAAVKLYRGKTGGRATWWGESRLIVGASTINEDSEYERRRLAGSQRKSDGYGAT